MTQISQRIHVAEAIPVNVEHRTTPALVMAIVTGVRNVTKMFLMGEMDIPPLFFYLCGVR